MTEPSVDDAGFSLASAQGRGPALFFARHAQAALFALGRLNASRVSTLMTVLVIAVALALPAGLFAVVENVRVATGSGQGGVVGLALHLEADVSDERVDSLLAELNGDVAVADVRAVSRSAALEEYRALTGFEDVLDLFEGENPLGPVLVVEPANRDPASLQDLVERWSHLDGVESGRFDLAWVQRLEAILAAAERSVAILGGFLLVAVLLVVGNTIRLSIENERDAVVIIRLFGATDAFVRRPFLYAGAWQGLAGGVLAWLSIEVAAVVLAGPVHAIAALYSTDFSVAGLGVAGFALSGLGGLLGLSGAWLAVTRELARGP